MSKKLRVSPITDFQINTDIATGDLPALDEVNQTVAALTGKSEIKSPPSVSKPPKEKIVAEKQPKQQLVRKPPPQKPPETVAEVKMQLKYGRPQKEIAAGRVKFTTMLQPEIVKQLKRQAIDDGITVADLLESLLQEYFSTES